VQDERLPRLRLDEAGQLGLVLGGVDVGVLVVVEQPKEPVDPHVDARGLQHAGVVGVEGHSSGVELGGDVTVGEEHGRSLPGAGWRPAGVLLGCGLDPAPGRSRECSSMVELQLPKLIARVRFPSLAPQAFAPLIGVRLQPASDASWTESLSVSSIRQFWLS
jgi:hypothetical protein